MGSEKVVLSIGTDLDCSKPSTGLSTPLLVAGLDMGKHCAETNGKITDIYL